jgi:hypothetical protein
MGDRKQPSPPPGAPGYTGPTNNFKPSPPPAPPRKQWDGPYAVRPSSSESSKNLVAALTALAGEFTEMAEIEAREADQRRTANVIAPANLSYHTACARARTWRLCAKQLGALLQRETR